MKEKVLVINCRAVPGNWLRLIQRENGTITALYYLAPNNTAQSDPNAITVAEISASKPLLDYLGELITKGVTEDFSPTELTGLRQQLFWCLWDMNRIYLTQPDDLAHVIGLNRSLAIAPSDEDIVVLQSFLTDAYHLSVQENDLDSGPRFGLG